MSITILFIVHNCPKMRTGYPRSERREQVGHEVGELRGLPESTHRDVFLGLLSERASRVQSAESTLRNKPITTVITTSIVYCTCTLYGTVLLVKSYYLCIYQWALVIVCVLT